jgi:aspartate/methionine/tyrosine aminotransferase
MFPPIQYLAWARRYYGRVRCDLASSGIPPVELEAWTTSESGGGADRLREAIATYNDTPIEETIASLGTTHALWLAYTALTSPGDDVLVEEPAYEPLVALAEGVGAHVTRFPRFVSGRFELDPERIARAMTSRTRVVALTNLHNPSGTRLSDDHLRRIARIAEAGRAVLLVDEVYAPFDDFVDRDGVFSTSARRLAPNVVAVSSLTKCYGLGAERIGWMLGPADVVTRADDAITASIGMVPPWHALRATRALASIRALAERARSCLAGKRARVASWVLEQGFGWSAPDAGLFGFVTLPEDLDLMPVLDKAAREGQVLVAPGVFFGVPNGFRIAWSAPMDGIEEGLALLARALR